MHRPGMPLGKASLLSQYVPPRVVTPCQTIIRRDPDLPLLVLGHAVYHPAGKAKLQRLQHAVGVDQTRAAGPESYPQAFAGTEQSRDYPQRLIACRHKFLELETIKTIQRVMCAKPQIPISGLRKRSHCTRALLARSPAAMTHIVRDARRYLGTRSATEHEAKQQSDIFSQTDTYPTHFHAYLS